MQPTEMPDKPNREPKRRLDDVTVIIPYRADNPDRRRNIGIVIGYFRRFFEGHRMLLVEQAGASTLSSLLKEHHGVDHVLWPVDGAFHKSRLLNLAIAMAETPYCLLFDADVLLHPDALLKGRALLLSDRYDFVLPFNRNMIQIKRRVVESGLAVDQQFLDGLPVCQPGEKPEDARCERLYGKPGDPCVGGALMFSRRAMITHGGYNPNIVSYSCEDVELYSRLLILESRLTWLEGFCCYHLEHRRGADSRYNNFHQANLDEWSRVRAMDREQLWRYVHNGFRALVPAPEEEYAVRNTALEYSIRFVETSRTRLDHMTLALYTEAPSDEDMVALRCLLDDMKARFVNYEVMLFEAGGERCRDLHLSNQLVYYRLSPSERDQWRVLAADHSQRRRIALVDLSGIGAPTAARMLQDWLDKSRLVRPPARCRGIEVIDRTTLPVG